MGREIANEIARLAYSNSHYLLRRILCTLELKFPLDTPFFLAQNFTPAGRFFGPYSLSPFSHYPSYTLFWLPIQFNRNLSFDSFV